MSKKASDQVKHPQIWPHSVLQYEYVSQNILFRNMSLSMYVAGECEILMSNISRKEFKGRMRLLKKTAYFSSMFEWKRVLQFYAAWVRRIEMGLNSWRDDSSLIENTILFCKSFNKKQNKDDSQKSGQVWWCADFNSNKSPVQSPTHHKKCAGSVTSGPPYLSHLLAKRQETIAASGKLFRLPHKV